MRKWIGFISLLAILLFPLYAAAGTLILLNSNYAGIVLILLGILCMIVEGIITSYGIVGFLGLIAFVTGFIMLLDVNDPYYPLTLSVILIISLTIAIFFLIVIWLVIKSYKKKIVTGKEGLIGREGIVLNIEDQQITVQVLGEMWQATSKAMLHPGQKVKVTHVHGLTLHIEPIKKP